MRLGDKIKWLRKRKGWTQAKLAKETGLSKSYIVAIEGGRNYPRTKTLKIIADRLGVSINVLIKNRK